ncbi:MAG: hypothetical protein GY781_08545, partial [Gammaproteobacteria bacterium]|nr:hypothetical protein [Gammaproteobacteria bacterium]
MLENIRNKSNGPIAKFIIGLIIVPFAFAGVYSYFNVNSSNAVATVNGEDISLVEFDRSYRQQQQNWGENFDKYFNTDERLQQFRINVLQQLINQRLSSQAISEMGLRTSDNTLRQIIINTPDFHNAEGKFDEDRYKMLIQSSGYSTKQYQAARKKDMASTQFINAIQSTNFVLKNELDLNIKLQNQTRDISFLMIPQAHYLKTIDTLGEQGDEQVQSYYEMNKSRFAIPEKVSIEYLYLSKGDAKNITISDGQITEYYNDNISDFETAERRHVAHILITVPVDGGKNEESEAENKINQLASRIQSGESFDTVARESSEDDSSAESGGDLDWIERGLMDESFEDTAFSLTMAEPVSNVVRSEFGFHLIKLLEVDNGKAKPVEELKGEITGILQDQFVEDKLFDLKDKINEEAFEISDSLEEIANNNSLVVRKTGLFDKQFGIGLPQELQNQPAIIEAVFSEDVLYQSLNSELIELTDGNAVVLRLSKHQEAGVMPLDEVKVQIVNLLKQQAVREATEQAGIQIITALEEGRTTEEAT